jgi:hypothetical protein
MKSRSPLALLVASVLLLGCAGEAKKPAPAAGGPTASNPTPVPDRKVRLVPEDLAGHQAGCKVDGDCELMRADCCGCPRGGADTAVLRGHKGQVDGLLTCTGVFCAGAEVLACKSGHAVCREGSCVVEGGVSPTPH